MVRLIAVLLLLTACHTMTFEVVDAQREVMIEKRKAFFLWGLAPTQVIDAREMYPHGVIAIREETTFADGFFSFITLGIYSPRTSYYFCRPAATGAAS